MISSRRFRSNGFALGPGLCGLLALVALAGCASQPAPEIAAPAAPAVVPTLPSIYRSEEFVGRWGFAAYHKPEDRARTEAAARGQCNQPYIIRNGQAGGVIMHLADQNQPQELVLKGSPSGKNYIGPAGEPGGMLDREIESFDGRVLLMRWMDPEVQTRYGTSVYVRCGAEGAAKKRAVSRR